MSLESHARFSHHTALAVSSDLTGGGAKVLAEAPAGSAGKTARISRQRFAGSGRRSLSDDHRSLPESNRCFFPNGVGPDREPNEAITKLSLEERHYLFLFYDVAIQDVRGKSPVNRPLFRPCDGYVKLALEILDNRMRLPLNNSTRSFIVRNPENRVRLPDGRPIKIASSKETAPPVRPSAKRFHLTAYPTLA